MTQLAHTANELDEDPLMSVSIVREPECTIVGSRSIVVLMYSPSAKAIGVAICDTVSLFHAEPIETRRIMSCGESVCPDDASK